MSLGNKEIMADNIKRFLAKQGLNPRQLALELDFKYTTVNDWVNAKTYPRIDKIEIMANFFNVPKSALVEVYEPTPTNSNPLDLLTQSNKAKAITYINELLESQNQTINEPTTLYTIQTVTELAAGFGFSYDDDDVKTVQVANEPPRHDLASRVNGDSMLPDYEDGDVVYLRDYGFSNYSGQVCAIAINQESFIKKVYTDENGLRLVSLNPAYPDKFVGFPPDEDIHIKIYTVVGSDKVV